jgi:hypothetical protein
VTQMDITEFAARADEIIGGLPSHRTRGPVYVSRDGAPEAVVIRASAYAPRLHDFQPYSGGIVCHRCGGSGRIVCDTSSLGVMVEAANRHWNEAHR